MGRGIYIWGGGLLVVGIIDRCSGVAGRWHGIPGFGGGDAGEIDDGLKSDGGFKGGVKWRWSLEGCGMWKALLGERAFYRKQGVVYEKRYE
ncbi:hypothetical protein F4810DRAFT_660701 [Camillea tinctor]|nr:hypothetical protein F4810DRAFT_660701 [Camillea tinctor]